MRGETMNDDLLTLTLNGDIPLDLSRRPLLISKTWSLP